MKSIGMFITTLIYTILMAVQYPDWVLFPQSPTQLIAQGIGVVMFFACLIMREVENKD